MSECKPASPGVKGSPGADRESPRLALSPVSVHQTIDQVEWPRRNLVMGAEPHQAFVAARSLADSDAAAGYAPS